MANKSADADKLGMLGPPCHGCSLQAQEMSVPTAHVTRRDTIIVVHNLQVQLCCCLAFHGYYQITQTASSKTCITAADAGHLTATDA